MRRGCRDWDRSIIFDRWFGSFREEHDGVSLRYGLVEPMIPYNPIEIGLREWLAILRDALSSRSLRDLLHSTLGAPRASLRHSLPASRPLWLP